MPAPARPTVGLPALVAIVSVPERPSVAGGLKVTAKSAKAPGWSVPGRPRAVVAENSAELLETLVTVSAVLPLLESRTLLLAAVVPTRWLARERAVAIRTAGAVCPLPM